MPKRGREPGGRRVALLASVRKAESRMVCRPLIVRRVARVAVRGKRIEPAIRMAASTSQAGVGARQWKTSVIISRRTPAGGAVALIAGMGEALSHVAGRRLIGGGVTGIAVRRDSPQDAARMATGAVQSGMPAREPEEVVTHKRLLPAKRRVATLTVGRPSAGGMIRGGRPRQVGPVAQVTFDWGPAKLAGSGARVTTLTGRHRMGPKQREPRPGMLGDQPGRPPISLLVAPLAIQAQR
jgi:hypothetical protein